jgi:hypothetical protein
MNKLVYQPLTVLLRAEPSDAPRTSNAAKILWVVATLGTMVALCGAVAICLIAFNAFPPRTRELKAAVDVPILPATQVSPTGTAAAEQQTSAGVPLADTNQANRATIAQDHLIIDQMSTPVLNPSSTPAPVPKAEPSASDNELLKGERPDAGRMNPDTPRPEAVRKNLEKERRRAERKRSRLEEMYRKHAITSEAYKKGEEKYRSEIERYRREMNARRGPENGVAGQN